MCTGLKRRPSPASRGLLSEEADGGKHAQSAICQLLLLHDPKLGGILGLQAQWVSIAPGSPARVLRRVPKLNFESIQPPLFPPEGNIHSALPGFP